MNPKIIVTLGPSTKTEDSLRQIKNLGVDFVRVNMSHSEISDLEYFIGLAKKVGLPFIIDTEGSQVRSGKLRENPTYFKENQLIKLFAEEIIGNSGGLSLKPSFIIGQLEKGDLIQIDFDTLVLQVEDISPVSLGHILARVIAGGWAGSNKAVVIAQAIPKSFHLPPLTAKDYQAIELGLKENIGQIAVSFVRCPEDIDEVRKATKNSMKVISKIECMDALKNLDAIIEKTDFLLIDRGDLSKEIPIEKIPLSQKIIIAKAKKKGVGVFVATNLLETMIEKRNPTRAEANDVVNTILDGAHGLTLAAETAIGKYPLECIAMLQKLIQQASTDISNESEYLLGIKGRLHR